MLVFVFKEKRAFKKFWVIVSVVRFSQDTRATTSAKSVFKVFTLASLLLLTAKLLLPSLVLFLA